MGALTMRPGRSIPLGGAPRVTDYAGMYNGRADPMLQGVNAKAPTTGAAPISGERIAAVSPQGLGALLMKVPRGLNKNVLLGRGKHPSSVRPQVSMGPIPKLATGSGMTAARPGTALGFTPGGYAPPQQLFSAGMEYMPYLQEDHRSANPTKAAPNGLPKYGVSADSGWALLPTYKPHDWVWAEKFATQGRSPGAWQETSTVRGYRALVRYPGPVGYNLYNGVVMARPLSQSAYMLGYQTPANVAAQIGGGAFRPLGYGS